MSGKVGRGMRVATPSLSNRGPAAGVSRPVDAHSARKGRRALPRRATVSVAASCVEPGETVLVAGATGGVGQLLTARLLETGYRVKALTRSPEKAQQMFGQSTENLEIVIGDLRDEEKMKSTLSEVNAVCCVAGTTAFPSKRWDDNNNTEQTDKVGVGNLIACAPKTIKRFVLTTSAGVMRSTQFPFNLMDAFKVLTYKRMSEKALMESGIPYTIFRPSRLTDGPYTSYDLNTLLKSTRGVRHEVRLALDDCFSGETSRISIAEAILQSLQIPTVEGHAFAIESVGGEGPQQDPLQWRERFAVVS